MTSIVTHDGVHFLLDDDFSSRWQLPKNLKDELRLEEVLLPISAEEVGELLYFDRQARIRMRKTYPIVKQTVNNYEIVSQTTDSHIGLFITSMSKIGRIATLLDPVTDEWRLFVDIDEESEGKKEAYLRLGSYLRVYGSSELNFTLPGLPESTVLYEYRGEGEVPENYETERKKKIVSETPWISIMLAILYSIYQTASESHYVSHCEAPDPQATHWISYASLVPSGAHRLLQESHTIEEWALGLPCIAQYFPVTHSSPITERGHDAATISAYYTWLEGSDTLEDGSVNIDVLIRWWYGRQDLRERVRLADSLAGVYCHRRQYLISPTFYVSMTTKRTTHSTSLPKTSYSLDEKNDFLEFSVSETTLQLILLHTLRTRDRSLSPASLGLGGTPFVESEESGGALVYSTPEVLAAVYLSKALHNLTILPDELLLEIAIAYSDWKKIMQEREAPRISVGSNKMESNELECLLTEVQEPLPSSLYKEEDIIPQGDISLHQELYELSELYRTLSDNEVALLSYLDRNGQ